MSESKQKKNLVMHLLKLIPKRFYINISVKSANYVTKSFILFPEIKIVMLFL